jgi:acetolactate synthase-1/2/3 large subunit
MPTVARLVGDRLRAAGVRYVFGHPGGEVVELIEGFREAGLEFVLTRHETSAAFMAEAMAASNGVPGVCVATLGPGATNLVTGVAHASLDRGPLLVFTGQLAAERYEIVTHQKLDLRALFAPITKWQASLAPANAAAVVERALRVATRPRRGPVLIEVASDVPTQQAVDVALPRFVTEPTAAIDDDAVRTAAARLAGSQRPLILAGMDANDDGVAAALRRLAESWSVPVMVSPKAKGVFREDHPLFLGTLEGLGTAYLYDYIDTCDLVVMVGLDPVELDRDWGAKARIVHVGPLPNDDRYYGSEVEVVGPIDVALERMLAAAAPEPKLAAADVGAFRDAFLARVRPKAERLAAHQVLAELRAALPEDALVTTDVGYNKAVSSQSWPAYLPRTFFLSNGLSSMGYGLPAAIGLKLAHRDRAVAAVIGDGGLGMVMAELETAARLRLGVLVVVLADEALSQIRAGQERRGYAATGTTFGATDYTALARAFGIEGCEVMTVDATREAFRGAAGLSAPRLVAAYVDPAAYRV